MQSQISKVIIVCSFGLLMQGCKKFIKIPPPRAALVGTSVFSNNTTANKAQLSIYSSLSVNGYWYFLSLYPGLSADEFTNYSTSQDDVSVYSNSLLPVNGNISAIWSQGYNYVFQANAVLDGIAESSGLDPKVIQQLKGEAQFTRALMYFYLVNLYGDVALYLLSKTHFIFILVQRLKKIIHF